MSDLNGFIRNNRKFLKLKDGETFTGIYKGFVVGPNRFDMEKETVVYKFGYVDSDKTVLWQNGSTRVAEQMVAKGVGETVQITRKGNDLKTVYEVISLD